MSCFKNNVIIKGENIIIYGKNNLAFQGKFTHLNLIDSNVENVENDENILLEKIENFSKLIKGK